MKKMIFKRATVFIIILFALFTSKAIACPSIQSFTHNDGINDCPCTNPIFAITVNPGTDTLYAVWNFGDGIVDTTFNVTTAASIQHIYMTAGIYNVWVKLIGPAPCVDSAKVTVDVTCHLVTDTCPSIAFFSYASLMTTPDPCTAIEFNTGICGDSAMMATIYKMTWKFGDGNSRNDTLQAAENTDYQYGAPGIYTATVVVYGPGGCVQSRTLSVNMACSPPPCSDCISSFAPIPGRKYLVSAWVKEDSPAQSKTSYTYPSISVLFPSVTDSVGPFVPSGNIIDGWQRIEGAFYIPPSASDLKIRLTCTSGDDCYFDDVRVQPFDGSMKSFVYDPITMRLVAELDERNYATLYEYDEEGRLTRVKKETEKGIMTIKENRNSSPKTP